MAQATVSDAACAAVAHPGAAGDPRFMKAYATMPIDSEAITSSACSGVMLLSHAVMRPVKDCGPGCGRSAALATAPRLRRPACGTPRVLAEVEGPLDLAAAALAEMRWFKPCRIEARSTSRHVCGQCPMPNVMREVE
jgi:hypothetical protein